MNILITDDEEEMREDLHEAIERVSPGNTYHFANGYDPAIEVIKSEEIDLAFLDINMPGKSGIEIARTIKKIRPNINIIIVTAYAKYALHALRLFVSGYILKPVMDDELKEVLDNLRNPIPADEKPVEAKCFGNFDIFYRGKAISFSRQKEKELLAYLICLNGSSANRAEICANIFEDKSEQKGYEYMKKIVQGLKRDLDKLGISDLVIHNRNSYAVNTQMIECDYYHYLNSEDDYLDAYHGEFMNQYSWAEIYIYELENY